MDSIKKETTERALFVRCSEDGQVMTQEMGDLYPTTILVGQSEVAELARMEEITDLFEHQFTSVCEELSISNDVQNEMLGISVCLHTLRFIEAADLVRYKLNTIQKREVLRWIKEFVHSNTIPPIMLLHPFDFEAAFSNAADRLLINTVTQRVLLFNGICARSLPRLKASDLVFADDLCAAQKHALVAWAHHAAEVFQLP